MLERDHQMKRIKNTFTSIVVIVLLGFASNALATTTCSANASNLAFGNISMGMTQNNTATIAVNCNSFGLSAVALTTVRIRMCLNIGAGTASESTISSRVMTMPSLEPLQFKIYRDASLSQTWGDSVTEDLDVDLEYSVLLLGAADSKYVTMYGQVPAQLGLTAGNYQNVFAGSHTRLDYRYTERLLILAPNWPTSCTSGGNGGGSITFPFTANASVPASCEIEVVNNLNFGNVPGLINNNNDQTTNFSFTCTKTTPWKVSLDNGLHASGTTRRMRLNTSNNYVEYELYRDSAHTLRWGNTLNIDTENNIGTGSSQNLTVYGRVPAPQSVPSGNYNDTVTVTITY
jgi:spore coat protein U-like protein